MPDAAPATPRDAPRGRPPWWIMAPAVVFTLVALLAIVAGIAALTVNDAQERATASRLIANWSGDSTSLVQAQRRLQLVMVTRPFDARAWALASQLARVSGDPGDRAWDPKVVELSHVLARRAIAIAPRAAAGHVAEGWTYACAHDGARAAAEAARAQALAPGDPATGELLAALARSDHRNAEALAGLRTVIAASAADTALRASAGARLAALYGDLGEASQADSCWRAAIALTPGSLWLRRGYVRFLGAYRRHDDAVAAADEAVALADNAASRGVRAAALVDRGLWRLEDLGQAAQAYLDFERANRDQPEDPGILYNLATCHLALFRQLGQDGQRAAAQTAIDHAARLAPDDPQIRRLREFLLTQTGDARR